METYQGVGRLPGGENLLPWVGVAASHLSSGGTGAASVQCGVTGVLETDPSRGFDQAQERALDEQETGLDDVD